MAVRLLYSRPCFGGVYGARNCAFVGGPAAVPPAACLSARDTARPMRGCDVYCAGLGKLEAAAAAGSEGGGHAPCQPAPPAPRVISCAAPTGVGLSEQVLRSVIKFYANVAPPNFLIPWQRKQQAGISGSGFVVDQRRRLLLTNCHVVAYAPFVEVRKHGDSNKYVGLVLYCGVDCDLALVHVYDDAFWGLGAETPPPDASPDAADAADPPLDPQHALEELVFDTAPYEGFTYRYPHEGAALEEAAPAGLERLRHVGAFDGIPQLQTGVRVAGYPMGGDQISITSGVISRVDISTYGGKDELLAIQLDAAINKGNSGGPALIAATVPPPEHTTPSDGQLAGAVAAPMQTVDRVIGVAFQTLKNADNIGYIIPIPVIASFFRAFMQAPVLRHLENQSIMARFVRSMNSQEEELRGMGEANDQDLDAADDDNGTCTRNYHPGFPSIGFVWSEMQNASLRQFFGLGSNGRGNVNLLLASRHSSAPKPPTARTTTGILCSAVLPLSCARGQLRPKDVITHVNGHAIANDGTILFRARERLSFRHIIKSTPPGQEIHLQVLRRTSAAPAGTGDGGAVYEPLLLSFVPQVDKPLVPEHVLSDTFAERPKYYIFGGLVFSPLTFNLIQEWGNEWFANAPRGLTNAMLEGLPRADVDGHVVVVQVLAHEVNRGYENVYARRITKVNGVPIRNFSHFASLMDEATGRRRGAITAAPAAAQASDGPRRSDMIAFDVNIYNDMPDGMTVVLPREASSRADLALMRAYNIRDLAAL